MDIRLPAKYLAAASFCQADGADARYFLNGICIHYVAEKVQVLGTNGHVLVQITTDIPWPVESEDVIIRLSADQRREVRKVANLNTEVRLNAEFSLNGCTSPLELVDGIFPDCGAVMKSNLDDPAGDPPAFDPALLARFVSVAKVLNGDARTPSIRLTQHGEHNATEVTFPAIPDDVCGLIMPLRVE